VNLVLTSRFFQRVGTSRRKLRLRGAGCRPAATSTSLSLGVARCCPTDPHLDGNHPHRASAFLPSVFRSVRGTCPARCVLATGRGVDPGPAPANFRVSEYVPQLELLERAAPVRHATAGAIACMKPYWPASHDAWRIARFRSLRLCRAPYGARSGLRVQPAPDPATLRSLALEILGNPAFARQARVLGDSLRAAGGAARAAESLVGLATPVPSPCLRNGNSRAKMLGKNICENGTSPQWLYVQPESDAGGPGSCMKRETVLVP